MQKIVFICLLLLCFGVPYSWASDKLDIKLEPDIKQQIRLPTPVKIKKVVDETSLLSESGEIYSLSGLDVPDDNETPSKVQKRLIELTEGKKCTLYQTRSDKIGRINRMNHILGHLTCGNNDIWIQGTLIAEGLARVRTTPENKEQSLKLLELEGQARTKKLGLWSLPMNSILTPLSAQNHLNSFVIVEGKIYTTSQNKTNIFLNFTSDWKTDFSIGIPSKLRKDFSKLRIDPMSLRGKNIRVRGWMRDYNGPYIELDHAEQLEIISGETQPPQKEENQAIGIIERIMESGEASQKKSDRPSEKQFMHTISGPTKPTIEKPDIKKLEPSKPVDQN